MSILAHNRTKNCVLEDFPKYSVAETIITSWSMGWSESVRSSDEWPSEKLMRETSGGQPPSKCSPAAAGRSGRSSGEVMQMADAATTTTPAVPRAALDREGRSGCLRGLGGCCAGLLGTGGGGCLFLAMEEDAVDARDDLAGRGRRRNRRPSTQNLGSHVVHACIRLTRFTLLHLSFQNFWA